MVDQKGLTSSVVRVELDDTPKHDAHLRRYLHTVRAILWPDDVMRSPIDMSFLPQPDLRSQEHHISAGAGIRAVVSFDINELTMLCQRVLLSSRTGA
jgi:hypothetical protein